jgi:hypothetical protein
MLAEDGEMHHICRKLGFRITESGGELAHGDIEL